MGWILQQNHSGEGEKPDEMIVDNPIVQVDAPAGTDLLSFVGATITRDWPTDIFSEAFVVIAPPGQVRRIVFNHPSELHVDNPWTVDILAGMRVKIKRIAR
jgi:hypothetical protein